MAKMIEIAAKLTERTSESRIRWKSDAIPNSYAAQVGELSVKVISEPVSRWDPPKIRLGIQDADGTEIAYIKHDAYGPESEKNPALIPLFEAARNAALNVDEQLDQLFTALETGT